MNDPTLLALTNRNVPRYTSYPTAPHFGPEVTAQTYAEWLAQVPADSAVSLYLHIPFCRQICAYCGCNTRASLRDEPIIDYVDVLRREMALVARHLGHVRVSHIHWGGGTPNLVPPALFAEVVDDIHRLFDVDEAAEHAIELDPRHVDREGARALAAAGINRASLGVQDFNDSVQEMIGRIQPLPVVEEAMAALRAAGIEAINFDLIYGLPGQTAESVRRTTTLAAGMAPSRIALFGYAHVPWFKVHQRLIDEARLPDQDLRLQLSAIAREVIGAFGYDPVGIDHFARPEDELAIASRTGQLHRNFQGYTTDHAQTLVGLGASSIGQTPFGYVQNPPDVPGWARAINAGELATQKGKAFTRDDIFRADIIEQILCNFSAELRETCRRYGMLPSVLREAREALAPAVDAGFVALNDDRVEILDHGPQLARVVASAFDSYLAKGGRHSIAV